jgi:ATP-binding cassette, subfamily B, bacterial
MTPPTQAPRAAPAGPWYLRLRQFFAVFRYSRRALRLVWSTSRKLTIALVILSAVAGVLPALIAYVGKLIVDAVVLAAQTGEADDRLRALQYMMIEAGVVVALAATQRGIEMCRSLLRALLGHRVNVLVLEKALTLELRHFEDSEVYDKMTQARREASTRPLSLVMRTFGIGQHTISLISYAGILLAFSGWAVIVLVIAALPAFMAEAKFSGEAFRLFRWRTPEAREQMYLETVLAREDYVKEVKLFGIGRRLLARYVEIFKRLFREDRSLTIRRNVWGFVLGALSSLAFYGAYAWIIVAAAAGEITLGDMTMYLMVFRQGQSSLSSTLTSIGGMYEDNLYVANLYEFLEQPVDVPTGSETRGPEPDDGIRFEAVSFAYPGADELALREVSFHVRPGEKLALVGENGSGKTTLIKLLARLYHPTSGRVTLDGLDLREWDLRALRRRISVIFQDFARYQLKVGENVGVGDVAAIDDAERWAEAAEKGMAAPFIEDLPSRYDTQLGRWFRDGRELSGGQWQKIALSRAFMREGAPIMVLDEPTAAMDAEAEARVFQHVRDATGEQIVIVISHRFSTVRMADHIIVLALGQIQEQGSHEELMELGGTYARLFTLQAAGYQ